MFVSPLSAFSFVIGMANKNVSYRKQIVGVHGRACNKSLACSLITMEYLVVVSHTVCAHVGGPKIVGCWGTVPWDRRG